VVLIVGNKKLLIVCIFFQASMDSVSLKETLECQTTSNALSLGVDNSQGIQQSLPVLDARMKGIFLLTLSVPRPMTPFPTVTTLDVSNLKPKGFDKDVRSHSAGHSWCAFQMRKFLFHCEFPFAPARLRLFTVSVC